jgi:hypothetical protein
MENTVFTPDNIYSLQLTCKRISMLADEHIDGQLMAAQLMMLADNIKDFINNPIVKQSGILEDGK